MVYKDWVSTSLTWPNCPIIFPYTLTCLGYNIMIPKLYINNVQLPFFGDFSNKEFDFHWICLAVNKREFALIKWTWYFLIWGLTSISSLAFFCFVDCNKEENAHVFIWFEFSPYIFNFKYIILSGDLCSWCLFLIDGSHLVLGNDSPATAT